MKRSIYYRLGKAVIGFVILLLLFFSYFAVRPYDVTILGPLNYKDGLGRQGIDLYKLLSKDVAINYVPVGDAFNRGNLPFGLYLKSFFNLNRLSKVNVVEGGLGYKQVSREHKQSVAGMLNNLSKSRNDELNIYYSMFETDSLPKGWVEGINKHFDMVVVPAKFLFDVYQKEGVKVPIFYLPLGVDLEGFLRQPIKKSRNEVFTFGSLSTIDSRKNTLKLVTAFHRAFKDRDDVQLVLNSRSSAYEFHLIMKYINLHKINNRVILYQSFIHYKSLPQQ